jgi:hypothetical protein
MERATLAQPGFWVSEDAFDLRPIVMRTHRWRSYDTDRGAWVETDVILDHPMGLEEYRAARLRGELKIVKRIKDSLYATSVA